MSIVMQRSRVTEAGTLAKPTAWFARWLQGAYGDSDVGFEVTETTSLRFTAVFAAVKTIAETAATLPLVLYERQGQADNDRRRAYAHPLYPILHDDASSEVTSQVFRETIISHALLWGNGYAEIERNNAGRPVALHILPPPRVGVERNAQGRIVYHVQSAGGGPPVTLQAKDVFHLAGLGHDGIVGYSPIRLAARAIGLGQAAERLGARIMANGAVPGGVLEHPGALGDDALQNLKRTLEDGFTGKNSGKPLILEEGMKWKSMTIPFEDLQFLELRQYQPVEIARLYRIPPHKIGILDKATFSNIEQQAIEFVQDTMLPWLKRYENEARRKLLSKSEQRSMFVEHLVDGLLRGDTKSRFEAYRIGRDGGWLSPNDILQMENKPARTDEGGDEYIRPLNMVGSKESEDDRNDDGNS